MATDTARYTLEAAFNENVAGVFTVDGSALDGTDGLTDLGLFDGTFDDLTGYMQDPIQVVVGTDHQMGSVQPSNLTVTVANIDEPDYFNPNNPGSPLNSEKPGFTPMRPVRLTAKLSDQPAGTVANYDRNPRFGVDTLTWNSFVTAGGTVTLARITGANCPVGDATVDTAGRVTFTPPASGGSSVLFKNTDTLDGVPVAAGDVVYLHGCVRLVSGPCSALSVQVRLFTAAGALIGATTVAAKSNPAAGTWYELEGTYTVLAGTAYVEVQILAGGAASVVTVFDATALSIAPADAFSSYCDGDQFGFSWAGTPNESQTVVDEFGLFRGYIRHATWHSDSRSCELYCEDILLWASRVFPTIPSTGPINVGQAVTLLFQTVDPTVTPVCDDGIGLDDFSADGTRSVIEILTAILQVDLGMVYVDGDGTPRYEQHDAPLARPASATISITDQTSVEQSGIDLDEILTRAAVEKTDPVSGDVVGSWTSLNAEAEKRYGRSDAATVSSPYVGDGQALADEVVYGGATGKIPVQFTLANVDAATLAVILTARPNVVYTVVDDFGGTDGDVIAQQLTHTIQTGLHQVEYLCAARPNRAFTVDDSALDGPDGLRYP